MGLGNGTNGSGTGAIPGPGATPGQPAPNVPPAGATPDPAAAGSPPAPATPPVTPPATGDDQLGEAGRRAIASERQAREAAEARAKGFETELQQLREATASDAEKATAQAVRTAVAEERGRWQTHIRTAEVRSALRAAGMSNEKTLALAVGSPDLAKLKVTDEGTVDGLAEAIAALKKDQPELFAGAPAPATPPAPPAPGGAWDGSAGGGKPQPASLEDAVAAHYAAPKR